MRLAVAAGLSLWTLTGIALFSDMVRLHPRYVEGFVPAVAALLGHRRGVGLRERIGGGLPPSAPDRARRGARGRASTTSSGCCTGAPVSGGSRSPRPSARSRSRWSRASRNVASGGRAGWLAGAAIVLTLVTVGALPLSADIASIDSGVTDAGYVGALPREEQRLVSAYLRSHQGSARYELAAESATQIGSLVVQDGAAGAGPDDVRRARVHDRAGAAAGDRARRGEVRVPEHVLRQTHLADQRRLLTARRGGSGRTAPTYRVRRGSAAAGCCGCYLERLRELDDAPTDEAPDLSEIADAARASGQIALDTEFMGEGRYRTLLCLIQLAVPEGCLGRADRARRPAGRGSGRRAAGGRARRPGGAGGGARRAPGHRARAPPVRHRGAERVRHAGRRGVRGDGRAGVL